MIRKYLFAALGSIMLFSVPAYAQKAVVTVSGESFAYTPFYAALAMDYFEKVGLDVELQKASSGSKAAAATIGGNADIYVGSTVTVLNAQQQGAELVAFAPVVTQYTSSIAVSKKWAETHNVTADSPIEEKYKALKGMRVAVTGPGSGTDQIIRYLAREAGLDPDRDLQIIGIGSNPSSMLAALQQDQVDAIVYSPPTPELAEKEQDAVILFNNNIGAVKSLDGFFYIAAIARRDWLEANPEAATKFAAGLQLALNGVRDPEIAMKAKAGVRGTYIPDLDDEILERLWSDLDKTNPKTVKISRPMMEQVVNFFNMFATDKIDLADIDKFYSNEFAAKAIELSKSVGQ